MAGIGGSNDLDTLVVDVGVTLEKDAGVDEGFGVGVEVDGSNADVG